MLFKVIPFTASVSSKGSAKDVADQVQDFIINESNVGWEFVSCGNVDTQVAGSNGCFGFGASPSVTTSTMVLVFKK